MDIRNGLSPHEWRVNNFDLVRLFAALQVAVVHALASFTPSGLVVNVLRYGLSFFPGVPIFFVVSGVLVSKSYEQSESLRDYFRNRCLRIFPALWVCLIVSLGVICLSGVSTLGTVSTWQSSLWWMAQMNEFESGGLNGSLWTIPIELEFYLLLPVLYRALRPQRQRGHALILAVLLLSLALDLIVVRGPKYLGSIAGCDLLRLTLLPYLWMFLVGVLIQRTWHVLRGKLIGRAHWWFLGYLFVCMLARSLHIDVGGNDINPIIFLPLAALVISFAMSVRGLSERVLRQQDVSYGLYIYHALVIRVMSGLGLPSATGAIAISLAIAAVSWIFVERSFLIRKRGALRTMPTRPFQDVRTRRSWC